MAGGTIDYTALIAKWATLSGTTASKMAQVNALTVAMPQRAIFVPSSILNACVAADLEALTVTQVALLQLLLAGTQVDASAGTAIRAVAQNIFSGKPTLTNLGTLVAPFDNATIPWWQATIAQGGGGLTSSVSAGDLSLAGNLT